MRPDRTRSGAIAGLRRGHRFAPLQTEEQQASQSAAQEKQAGRLGNWGCVVQEREGLQGFFISCRLRMMHTISYLPELVPVLFSKPMPIAVRRKIQSTPAHRAIAILLLCAAAVAVPQLIAVGFVTGSFAGSLLLIYAGFQRRNHRSELFDLAAWLPLCAMLAVVVQLFFGFLPLKPIDASLNFGIGPAFYAWGKTHYIVMALFKLIYLALPFAMAASLSTSVGRH